MGHGLEMMVLAASQALEGDRTVLLPVTKGERLTHSDLQIDTPHTHVCMLA